jgi:cytochrome c oxidase assembly factor CtaG
MLQHVLVGDLAPALALVALRGRLLFAFVPRPLRRLLARSRVLRLVLRPGPSLVLWGGSLWLWHIPAVYDLALENQLLHDLEHASFLVGGLLVWNQLVDPAGRRTLGLWGSLGYAFGVMVVAQMLVALLVLSYRPLYPAYADGDGWLGLTPLADQQTAGLLMALEQLATLGTFALVRLRAYAREPLRPSEGHPLGA